MTKINQNYLNQVFHPSKQKDDIIDMNGKKIPKEIRNQIIEQISSLPILKQLPEITKAIQNNLITIIEAKTWSWKTTQVGKIALLLKQWKKRWFNKVHMTQPRVLAALSNASRISDELLSQTNNILFTLWEVVWYRTGNFDKTSQNTKLLLTTDAQEVLRQLVSKILPDYLILDEVHTYTVDIEVLLAMMKQYIAENPEIKTKFIIMTATLDKKLIINYLKDIVNEIPYFDIPWKVYPIDEYILPSNQFINAIVENTDIDGDGKVLVFVEWKKKIYDTIKSLERIFGKNMKEAKTNQVKLEFKTFLDKSIEKLKKHFWKDFEQVVNQDSINSFSHFFSKEIENKIKNVAYIVNTDKVYTKLYEIFYTEITDKISNPSDKTLDLLNEIYSNWLETINNITENINYLDYKILDFVNKWLKRKTEKVKSYQEIVKNLINKSNYSFKKEIIDKLDKINFWTLDGFSFMIQNFLRKTIDKWVNHSLVEKNIALAWEHLHPSKIYDFYKRQVNKIIETATKNLKTKIRKNLMQAMPQEKANIHIFVNWVKKWICEDYEWYRDILIKEQEFYQKELKTIKELENNLLQQLWKEIFSDNLYEEFVNDFKQTIEEIENYLSSEIKIVPLHSDLPQKEQEKAFDKDTKIIVATDIAEMSLTIPNTKTVVDNGKVRIAYIDEDGIETLEVINISQAQSKQRMWRTWRTWFWKYIWTNSTPPEKLIPFPITDIEKWNFARHYLILLAGWKKMEEMDFLHKPNEKHIELVKKHLQSLGAIDKNDNITDIGEKMVLLPIEPYTARMLVEAEKRDCVWNMIIIASIFEAKTFLSSENHTWKKIKFEKNNIWTSDIFLYYQWYKLLTSTQINKFYKNQLINLWIRKDVLDNFNNNNKKLFEEINLEKLWIKEKYFLEVLQNIERLEKHYQEKNISLNSEWNINSENILLSIASGLIDNIFEYERKNTVKNNNKWIFNFSWTWSIKANPDKEYVYIWKPLIIKSDSWKKTRILQKATRISKKLIAQIVDLNIDEPTLSLTTKVRWKWKNRKRVKLLKQIKPIEWINIDEIAFERWKDSFEYMFKHIYLPELFVYKNKSFNKFVEEINKQAPEWQNFNTQKFKTLIWNYTNTLYEKFMSSEESPKKLEEKFINDKLFLKYLLKQKEIQKFLENPYI